jgi:hypothetical protein
MIVIRNVDLNNAILIIDEVHNLFRTFSKIKKQEHEQLEKILDLKKYPN